MRANKGCNNPNSPSGQCAVELHLPAPEKLLDLDLLEDAICFCNKPGCREYILGNRRRNVYSRLSW